MRSGGNAITSGLSSSTFSSAAGNLISFARGIADNGVNNTLIEFGRDDLIGKSPDAIISALLDQFTNHSATVEDSLASAALSSAIGVLNIQTMDDLGRIDLDTFLLEMIIAFVNNDFDFCFYEKIAQGRTPEKTLDILQDVHGYIEGTIREHLTRAEIGRIDYSRINANRFVSQMLDNAFATCMSIYGDDTK